MSALSETSVIGILIVFSFLSVGVASPSYCRTCVASSKLELLEKQLEHLNKEFKELTEHNKGPNCNSSWALIFENDQSGKQVSGSRAELIKIVRAGASVRVVLWDSAMEADYIHISGDQVSVQLLQTISTVSWQSFEKDSKWVWTMVTTNGATQQVRYDVGASTFRGEKLARAAVKWFAKRTSCGEKSVYSHDKSGRPLSGSLVELMTSVKKGADIRCVSSQGSAAFPVQNVALTNTFVSGQTLSHISIIILQQQNVARFQSNAYWWFTQYTTLGTRDMSRWTVGEHVSRGHTQDAVDIDWFADPCWKRVYSNDKSGGAIFGARADLVTAIERGSRVRVQFSSFYTVEADNLSIRNGHVIAQVLKHVSKQDLIKMQDNAYWYWQMISTTGTVQSTRYLVGKHQRLSTTKNSYEVHWFVDIRPWKLVYAHDAEGKSLQGSEQQVVNAVRSGSAIRGYYDMSGPNSNGHAFAFQNVRVHGQNVAGQTTNHVSAQDTQNNPYDMEFQSNDYWWFVIITTQGRMEMIRWSVGAHTPRAHNTVKLGLKWFANE